MIRCAKCEASAPDGAPGWKRAGVTIRDKASGKVLVEVDEDLCPECGREALGLTKEEDGGSHEGRRSDDQGGDGSAREDDAGE